MTMKNTLTSIVLSGALALSVASCKVQSIYNYNEKIAEEQVKFQAENRALGQYGILTVEKTDGRTIEYVAKYIPNTKKYKVEEVIVTTDGNKKPFNINDPIGKLVVAEGQTQLDTYLPKIKQDKIDKALELIKE